LQGSAFFAKRSLEIPHSVPSKAFEMILFKITELDFCYPVERGEYFPDFFVILEDKNKKFDIKNKLFSFV